MSLVSAVAVPALQAAQVWSTEERVAAVVGPLTGLALAFLVHRFVQRTPWPQPFRMRFLLLHVVAGPLFAIAWMVSATVLGALVLRRPLGAVSTRHAGEMVFIGSFLYVLVAGLSYAFEGSARAARAEALAARTQLAALRAQIHPHFLFNALHAVVQLIPVEPARAAEAAELVAALLRATLEEQRNEVSLADEWRFVSRYLDLERIRFGDRLVVRADIGDALLGARVPTFALQTLVENATRHGVAHRVEPTEIAITATGSASELRVVVRNAVNASVPVNGTGTGLSRLREQLAVLYGGAGRLMTTNAHGVHEAVLVVPRRRAQDA